MSTNYRTTNAALFIIAAILILLVIFSSNILASAAFALLFIFCQIIITIYFAQREEHNFHEWYALWTVIIASTFLGLTIFFGRNIWFEGLGILISLIYFISSIIFMLKPQQENNQEDQKEDYISIDSSLSDDELAQFRKKDEMEYLLDSFEIPEVNKQSHLTDYPDFEKEKKNFAIEEPKKENENLKFKDAPKDGYYEIKMLPGFPKEDEDEEGYIELYPDPHKMNFPQEIEKTPKKHPSVKVVELREAPKIELPKKSIDEKIKLIAEKAIEERALELKKKKLSMSSKQNIKIAKGSPVYSSITSNIFHKDKNCRSIKKTNKKNIILYKNIDEAKKRGLVSCRTCKSK